MTGSGRGWSPDASHIIAPTGGVTNKVPVTIGDMVVIPVETEAAAGERVVVERAGLLRYEDAPRNDWLTLPGRWVRSCTGTRRRRPIRASPRRPGRSRRLATWAAAAASADTTGAVLDRWVVCRACVLKP